MDLRDVRRLAGSALVVAAAVLLWMLFLVLDDRGLLEWAWPTQALRDLGLASWLFIGAGVLAFVVLAMTVTVFGINKGASARTPTRQVQCQDCKAVFFMPDNGRRPLTYPCPSCKALGVYDGRAEPIGQAPIVPVQKVARLQLVCRSCQNRFATTDTGIRPLHVECPSCKATGIVR